jgi:hypothetical protein
MTEKVLLSPGYHDDYRSIRTFYTEKAGFGHLEASGGVLPGMRVVFEDIDDAPPILLARGVDKFNTVVDDDQAAANIVRAATMIAELGEETTYGRN